MIEWLKQRFKSKTNRFNAIIGMLSILEVNFGLLREYVGVHYGWMFMVVMLINFYLREVTTQPIKEKQ